jgi:DNA-directed RNA polymerase specialized sigma24 family protein
MVAYFSAPALLLLWALILRGVGGNPKKDLASFIVAILWFFLTGYRGCYIIYIANLKFPCRGGVMKNMPTDQEILSLAQAGDKGAMDELGKRFEQFVLGICRKRVPECDAEDVANDAWVNIRIGMAGFRFKCTVKTWIGRVTQIRIADYYRKKKRRAKRELLVPDSVYEARRSGHPPTLSIVTESFPEPQNEREKRYLTVFALMEDGLTNEQIARRVGLNTPEAVRSTYRRGRSYYFSDSPS